MSEQPADTTTPETQLRVLKPVDRYSDELLDQLKSNLVQYAEEKDVFIFESGSNYSGLCPIHDDTKPSFGIFGEYHDRWKCHACDKGGDVFTLSMELGLSHTFPEAVIEVGETLGIPVPPLRRNRFSKKAVKGTLNGRSKPHRPLKPVDLTEDEEAFRLLSRLDLRDAIRRHPNIVAKIAADLGIPVDVIKQAARGASGLGLVDGYLSYVYPFGVKVRNSPGKEPRFYWPVARATAPWRFDRVGPQTTTVYLTEGESDALAIISAGVETDRQSVVVASPGTSFPGHWAPMFAGKHVVICFDFDGPGQTAAAKVAKLLSPHANSVSLIKH